MVHLRLIVAAELAAAICERLRATPGVAHVVQLDVRSSSPAGAVVLCDVVREAANDLIEWLQDQDVHRDGAIVVESLEAVVSDAAAEAEATAPGHAADALIWEEIEARARQDTVLTASYLVFSAIAALLAGIGVLLDSPVLIVGAMVVGPEYPPLAALCVAAVRLRWGPAAKAAVTLLVGLAVGGVATLLGILALRAVDLAPDTYELSDRQLTAFISHPDGLAAVVALLAGVIGMLSLTEGRSGALIGVLVSVTMLPAVANAGVATAYQEWSEVSGSLVQLAINIVGLVLAGTVTLYVQDRFTTSRPALRRRG